MGLVARYIEVRVRQLNFEKSLELIDELQVELMSPDTRVRTPLTFI